MSAYKDTGDIVVGDGKYMRSIATLDGNTITLQTHTFCHIKFAGFTGGVFVQCVDVNGQIIYQSGVVTYGVDGEDIPWKTSDRWDTQHFTVDASISQRTDAISIFQNHDPQNRLLADLAEIEYLGKLVVDFVDWLIKTFGPVFQTDSGQPWPSNPDDYIFQSTASSLLAALPAPALVSPAAGEQLYGLTPSVTFGWEPVDGATGYQVTVQYYTGTGPFGGWYIFDNVYITATSATLPCPSGISSSWFVQAVDKTGEHEMSPQSEMRTFSWTPAQQLACPVPLQPPDGSHFSNYPRTTTIKWQSIPNCSNYEIEVEYQTLDTSTGAVMWLPYISKSCYVAKGAYGGSYTFDFVGDQAGRWRVTAIGDGTGANLSSPPSPWRTFDYKTASAKPVLATPTLVSPAEGQHLFNYPRTTMLRWQQVPQATGYRVEVQYGAPDRSGNITWEPDLKSEVTDTKFQFDFVGSQPGRWRVTALDKTGSCAPSNPSLWRTFDYSLVHALEGVVR
jgi:hypothetical protein